MRKILVTGGLGFIGSNLVKSLSLLGHEITVVDDMSSSRKDFQEFKKKYSSVEYIESCFSSDAILDKIKKSEYNVVFHVAAVPRVSYSVENPYETSNINVDKTIKLISACRGNIERFVFSSSSSVYGDSDLPTSVDCKKSPQSPYAWQKSCIEDLLVLFGQLYNFDSISLRYFNVFGPGQYGDSAYATAISAWCHAVKNGLPLRSDGSGEQSRDLCYVDNVVNVNISAMNFEGLARGDRFNVACGDRTSNNEILDFFKSRFDSLQVENAPFRPGDVMHTQADIVKTKQILGYENEVKFWDGLERTLAWWKL